MKQKTEHLFWNGKLIGAVSNPKVDMWDYYGPGSQLRTLIFIASSWSKWTRREVRALILDMLALLRQEPSNLNPVMRSR